MKRWLLTGQVRGKKKYAKSFGYYAIQWTPQTALANYFPSKDDAIAKKQSEVEKTAERISVMEGYKKDCLEVANNLDSAPQQDIDALLKEHHIRTSSYDHYRRARIDIPVKEAILKQVKDFESNIYSYSGYVAKINALKPESVDVGIKFLDGRKKNIAWTDAPDQGGKMYCNVCGASVPGMKYLKIPGGYNNSDKHICAFCMNVLGTQVERILNDVEPDLIKQYKADGFMHNL